MVSGVWSIISIKDPGNSRGFWLVRFFGNLTYSSAVKPSEQITHKIPLCPGTSDPCVLWFRVNGMQVRVRWGDIFVLM